MASVKVLYICQREGWEQLFRYFAPCVHDWMGVACHVGLVVDHVFPSQISNDIYVRGKIYMALSINLCKQTVN